MEEKKKVQKISDEQLARKRKRRLLEVERASGQAKCNIVGQLTLYQILLHESMVGSIISDTITICFVLPIRK